MLKRLNTQISSLLRLFVQFVKATSSFAHLPESAVLLVE